MKPIRIASMAAVALLCLASPAHRPSAEACGWSSSTETVTQQHPDLPLENFAAGRLGILRPTHARSYLVVAYRHLQGIGLSRTEQRGAARLWASRLGEMGASPDKPWLEAKKRVLGTQPVSISTSMTIHHAAIENCLPDAFSMAAATLDARAAQFGAQSAEVREWVDRQDAVFANCDGTSRAIAAPSASTHPILAADAAYQSASAAFYAGRYDEAETLFRAIAGDASSPWQALSKYLVARALTRKALVAGPAQPALQQAERQIKAVLADPGAKPVHGASERYLQLLRFRTEPALLQNELAVSLARDRLDDSFQGALDDYTTLLDRNPAPMELTAPASDRLSAWLGVVQSNDPKAFDRAEALYRQTKSPAWLVAALMKAAPSHGARIDPLVAAAAGIAPSHPGYVSAQFHRIRLLSAKAPTDALFRETKSVLQALRKEDGISARNSLLALALQTAPTLDDLLDHALAVPAGMYDDSGFGVIHPPERADPALHPTAAALLSSKLPVAYLARAAQSNRLPDAVRAHVAAAAWIRALLLDDRTVAASLAPTVRALNPAMAPYVQRVSAAKSQPERRLAVLQTLLEVPSASTSVSTWRRGPLEQGGIDSVYDSNWWCGSAAAGGNAGNTWQSPGQPAAFDVRFLSGREKQARDREVRKLEQMGSAPTFLANEAAELAKQVPKDPRVPKLLHLAVRATRYGCKDAGTTPASRRAFRVLHEAYPKSDWAGKTPYYY